MNSDPDITAPIEPVELLTEKPKTRKKRTSHAKQTQLGGDAFSPNLENEAPGVAEQYYYWIGALPSCPSEHLDLHGIHFPKLTELVGTRKDGSPMRIPKIGQIVKLDKKDIVRMRNRLQRTIIRFRDPKPEDYSDGSGSVIEGYEGEPRKGAPITIPSQKELQEREAANLPARSYIRGTLDEPAANYLFAVLCDNQDKPERDDVYPEPLSVTGLVWPGDLE